MTIDRSSSRLEMFCKLDVLKNFIKLTENDRLPYKCFPVNFKNAFRTPFWQSTYGLCSSDERDYHYPQQFFNFDLFEVFSENKQSDIAAIKQEHLWTLLKCRGRLKTSLDFHMFEVFLRKQTKWYYHYQRNHYLK